MLILAIKDTINNNVLWALVCCLVFFKESNDLIHQPWHDLFLNSSVVWSNQHSHAWKLIQGLLTNAWKVVFSVLSSIYLLMGSLLLFFSSFVLNLSALNFFFAPLLSCLESLSNHELCVNNFFILFLLWFHDIKLCFFKDFHSGLLKSLTAKHIKHWFNFFIEVE